MNGRTVGLFSLTPSLNVSLVGKLQRLNLIQLHASAFYVHSQHDLILTFVFVTVFVLFLHYAVDFMLILTVHLLSCENGPAEDVTEPVRSETAD